MIFTPYPELNDVLQELVRSQKEILGANFVGTYLQGSLAVGDFDIHSDVDFIVVCRLELSGEEVAVLQLMHERIYSLESPWAQHLEGSYFPQAILRDPSRRGRELWYLDHGARSLIRSSHCNTLVVRWVVGHKGVALAGPSPETLLEPITAEQLRMEIAEVMAAWGEEILAAPQRYNNRFYQGFIVLSYCRMLYDLHTGRIGSKRTGAEWARKRLDPSWSGLIERAWQCRPDPARSVGEPADPDDFAGTLRFVRYVCKVAGLTNG